MRVRFGQVLRQGIYSDPAKPYSSGWLCLVIAQDPLLLMTLRDPASSMPVYAPGVPFRWTMPYPEKTWKVEAHE